MLLSQSCVSTPPVEEYNIARTALKAAQKFEAARYAPGYWHKAEQAYRRAEKAYDKRSYRESTHLFKQARRYAEKAEISARLIRFKSGEDFP